MQILANALPGFRDVRAPLTAGYMWLLFAWLSATPNIDHMTGGIGGSLHDLSQRVGPIWTALAAGVAAYLIGSISQGASSIVREIALEFPPFDGISMSFNFQVNQSLRASKKRGEGLLGSAESDPAISHKAAENLRRQFDQRFETARNEAERELELPAMLLVGDQEGLFAEVDRLRAEGELRMAVFPPLAALGILLGLEVSLWWFFLLPAAVLLFSQGIQRDFDAKKIISDATRIGRVDSSSVSKFTQWVEEGLPAEIERIRLG